MLAYIIAGREIRCSTVHGKCLLLYYCTNVNRGGSFFKSVLDICAETHLAESTVHRLNSGMKELGILSWVSGDWRKGLSNTYTLDLSKMQAMSEQTQKGRDAAKEKSRQKAAERARRYRANHSPSPSQTA
jgi:hypothetical protein